MTPAEIKIMKRVRRLVAERPQYGTSFAHAVTDAFFDETFEWTDEDQKITLTGEQVQNRVTGRGQLAAAVFEIGVLRIFLNPSYEDDAARLNALRGYLTYIAVHNDRLPL